MRTDLRFTHLTLVPGQPTRVAIEVTNTADVIDGVTAVVDGLDPDWIKLDQPLVRLFPQESGEVTFTLEVPRDCPAGDYLVLVRIVSTLSAERQSAQDFWVTVDPIESGRVELVPRVVSKGSKANMRAVVTNTGNTPTTFRLDAFDATGEVDCKVEPSEVRIGLHEHADAVVALRGPRPWFGQVVNRSIELRARSDDVELTAIGTFNQKPRISRGVMTFLSLAAIIALWALMFVFVIGFLRNQTPPPKAAATAFVGGEQSVPIAKIGAKATGTVTSSTEGVGIPGVSVRALRMPPDGAPELFAEVATDEDGVFEFPSLLPGDYQIRFAAAGFGERFYASAADATEPEVLGLAPATERAGLDVVLEGETGSFRGLIDQSGQPGNFRVTATLIDPDADPGADPSTAPEPIEGTVNPDGTYELGDLPAPNDYLVRIEDLDGNYATQEFVISVAAGEKKQLNPVVPTASNGRLAGVVTDGAGIPLGGVAVIVRNGDFVVESVTPTTGDTGSFQFIALPTPATYVVSFALDGYTGQTIALELGPGETLDNLRGQLVAGLGTVSGTVVDPAGSPLGAATVVLEGRGFSAETATLTDAGSTGGIGSFFLTGVPVPGSYTITFSLEGYEPVTIPVLFGASGGPLSSQAVLAPLAGRVVGTVTAAVDGKGIAEATVKLSRGIPERARTTTTSSTPLGAFSFAGAGPGAYTVLVTADGYAPFVRLIEVGVGGTVNADVALTKVEAPKKFVRAPALTITQTANRTTISSLGTVTYTIKVTNTGNIDLTGVDVYTSLTTVIGAPTGDANANEVLDVGETWTFAAVHTLNAAEVEAALAGSGNLVNTAYVETVEVPGPTSIPLPLTITPTEQVTLTQTVSPSFYAIESESPLTFTFTVENTGTSDLTGVVPDVVLSLVNGPGSPELPTFELPAPTGDAVNPGVLDIGEEWVYEFDVAPNPDVWLSDGLTSTATVAADDLTAPTPATATAYREAVTVTQSVSPAGYSAIGEVVVFTVSVQNTYGVDLAAPLVTASFAYQGGATPIGAATVVRTDTDATPTVFEATETWTYTITRTITATDMANTGLTSTVTVTTAVVPVPTTVTTTATKAS
ncbi:MAG TPA: carboxypeptidase regulatory-like domain-containing protein [Ilumatobacter sp.]